MNFKSWLSLVVICSIPVQPEGFFRITAYPIYSVVKNRPRLLVTAATHPGASPSSWLKVQDSAVVAEALNIEQVSNDVAFLRIWWS